MLSHGIPLPNPQDVHESTDIISSIPGTGRRVVGLPNDIVVKYGSNVDLDEAKSISFVVKNISIPVPMVRGSYEHDSMKYIFLTRLTGTPLSECLHSMSSDEYDIISQEMGALLSELRALRVEEFECCSYIGSVGFGEVKDKMLRAGRNERGPFLTEKALHSNICQRWEDARSWGNPKPNHYIEVIRRMYAENNNHEIVFTHADLHPSNILVNEGHISGIVDWQDAGWYPEYWEYVTIMNRCTGYWDTLWPLKIDKFLKPHDYMRLIDSPIHSKLS